MDIAVQACDSSSSSKSIWHHNSMYICISFQTRLQIAPSQVPVPYKHTEKTQYTSVQMKIIM